MFTRFQNPFSEKFFSYWELPNLLQCGSSLRKTFKSFFTFPSEMGIANREHLGKTGGCYIQQRNARGRFAPHSPGVHSSLVAVYLRAGLVPRSSLVASSEPTNHKLITSGRRGGRVLPALRGANGVALAKCRDAGGKLRDQPTLEWRGQEASSCRAVVSASSRRHAGRRHSIRTCEHPPASFIGIVRECAHACARTQTHVPHCPNNRLIACV